jgi:hypothetical protein
MRVRDHVAASTAGAVLLRRLLGRGALGFWAGGVLIDADHYLWYFATQRRLDPVKAVRFFNQAEGPQHPATRVLHNPVSLLLVSLLAARTRPLRSIAAGMCLHAALDAAHRARLDASRAAALARDSGRCQACGTSVGEIRAHLASQPWLGPSYRLENLISLCAPCHEAAHTAMPRHGVIAWLEQALPAVAYLVHRQRGWSPVREEKSATWTS